MNAFEQLEQMQQRINDITKERNQLRAQIDQAKKQLEWIVKHRDELSGPRLEGEIVGVIEEIL